MLGVNAFLSSLNIDHINLFRLQSFWRSRVGDLEAFIVRRPGEPPRPPPSGRELADR